MTHAVTPTRILLLGSGGREHALAWKLAAEPGVNEVLVAPGSEAIASEPRVRRVADIDPLDGPGVVALAGAVAAELVVIGPEAPLAAGVADALDEAGIPVFGPRAAAARIETSKAFCHEIASAAGVPMARAGSFSRLEPAIDLARRLFDETGGVVVKADGLMSGKGVTVCDTVDEAEAAIAALVEAGPAADGAPVLVVEERLSGLEASVIAIADGDEALALPAARDHKRLLDGDRGPNTGGMGAYSPLPDLPAEAVSEIVERVHLPVLAELARRGAPYRGALYAGMMLTDRGPVLLEFNARFGDPETQVLLPRTAVALGPLLRAAALGRLREAAARARFGGRLLPTIDGAAVGIVLAADGYPGRPERGRPIDGLDRARSAGALVFHAGTARGDSGGYLTAGGRVLTVVGRGADLATARVRAEAAADTVRFDGLQRRRDIAATPPAVPGTAATPPSVPGTAPVDRPRSEDDALVGRIPAGRSR
jgi:phosphoribosylamine---glycine ligase